MTLASFVVAFALFLGGPFAFGQALHRWQHRGRRGLPS